ncbi:MAG: hypothetical protein ACTSRP_27730, partial [Candidatus Helarchaeota archaeon]
MIVEENDYYCERGIFYVKYDISKNATNFNGIWVLKVRATENCMLEEFTCTFDISLDPLDKDCDDDSLLDGGELNGIYGGWKTNPANDDSDNDGWSDYYEIFSKNTNPLSEDTDGDGVSDPSDQDPLYNLML